jgi:hypothetical protein
MQYLNCDIFSLIGDNYIICHQCNCVATYGSEITREIFKRFPQANSYALKHTRRILSIPGTTELINCDNQLIANIYAQYFPGKPCEFDSAAQREEWFASALEHLAGQLRSMILRYNTNYKFVLLIPTHIGCGFSGGKWENYSEIINKFAIKHMDMLDILTCVYNEKNVY